MKKTIFTSFMLILMMISFNVTAQTCTHTVVLTDLMGDGWTDGKITISVDGTAVLTDITLLAGPGPEEHNFEASTGATILVDYTTTDLWPFENIWKIYDGAGLLIIDGSGQAEDFSETTTSGICLESNNLMVSNVEPHITASETSPNPQITIFNCGEFTETEFMVNVSITNSTNLEVYNSTKNITGASFLSGTELVVDMDDLWVIPEIGEYAIKGIVTLNGDINNENDTLVDASYVAPNLTGYAWNPSYLGGIGPGSVSVQIPTGEVALIAPNNNSYITGADWIDGVWYGLRDNAAGNEYLVTINPVNGIVNELGLTSIEEGTSLCHDVTSGITYAMDYYGALYTVDLSNASTTLIGGNTDFIVGTACDNNGVIYAISLNDIIYTINSATGVSTEIGDLGINLNFSQDIAYDRDNEILYGTLYTDKGGLYIINKITGRATLSHEYISGLGGFAIPYGITNVNTSITNNETIDIYPNPSNGIVNIRLSNNSSFDYQVTDLHGKIIFQNDEIKVSNKAHRLNFVNQQAGIYFIKISNKESIITKKIIIN